MPTYKFRNKETDEIWEEFFHISECDKFLKENPHIEQLFNGGPSIISGRPLKPTSNEFKSLLKEIKKRHKGSTIETF